MKTNIKLSEAAGTLKPGDRLKIEVCKPDALNPAGVYHIGEVVKIAGLLALRLEGFERCINLKDYVSYLLIEKL